MIDQEIATFDMREASRQELIDLAKELIDASQLLALQGYKIQVTPAKPERFSKKSKNCNAS